MKIKQVQLNDFKRFTDLRIQNLPPSRLVVLAGPNGSGKSSLFDGFKTWHAAVGGPGGSWDESYHRKAGRPATIGWPETVKVEFHEDPLPDDRRKSFYIRSAYRNEPHFGSTRLEQRGELFEGPSAPRMIDNDVRVADNYQRAIAQTIYGVFSGDNDEATVLALREKLIGEIRESMQRVFGGLVLQGIGDPFAGGTFFFEKGSNAEFQYQNLSGGEKAAFDLILDLCVKRAAFDDTVFCIDEPELHMNTRLQAHLLGELVNLIPENSQLWVATHSIGMMRKARDLAESDTDVTFLDFADRDFNDEVVIEPTKVNRDFWNATLDVALGDLASLVAPATVVFCEGRPATSMSDNKAEFDASCYRVIFGNERPDVDFISVGNSTDVSTDRLDMGRTIQTLTSGTQVRRLIDRDDLSEVEVVAQAAGGVRVLSRRTIESFLLDDEVLALYCVGIDKADMMEEILGVKRDLLQASIDQGRPPDDFKRIAGDLYVQMKARLSLTQVGNTARAFMRDSLSPLIKPGTETYAALEADIFGD